MASDSPSQPHATAVATTGSTIAMMLWVYYSAQIFLIGAEFTWVYAHEYGSRRGMDRDRPQDAVHVAQPQGRETAGSTAPARAEIPGKSGPS